MKKDRGVHGTLNMIRERERLNCGTVFA